MVRRRPPPTAVFRPTTWKLPVRWAHSVTGSVDVLGGRGHTIAISAGEPVIAYPRPPGTRPALGRAPGRRRRAGGGIAGPVLGRVCRWRLAVLAGTTEATGLSSCFQ